jgi:hypothetical protein
VSRFKRDRNPAGVMGAIKGNIRAAGIFMADGFFAATRARIKK